MSPRTTDVRVTAVSFEYEDHRYRSPIKFGGVALDRATLLNVRCTVETLGGRVARGFGSMPLGNVWSFPSRVLSYEATLKAMRALVERIAVLVGDCKDAGHPIDLYHRWEPELFRAAEETTRSLQLAESIPKLCTLVAASAFDAAVHDAFGKAHGLNCYHTYGPEFMTHDLGHYLGKDFAGEHLDRYLRRQPQPRMPLYHLVGALDPLEESDLPQRFNDGLPETLPEWIRADGLTHLKIKLNGDDLAWDVERVVRIDRVAEATQRQRGIAAWVYSLDFNERCGDVAYLLEFLDRVKAQTPAGFGRIQYIEQPTSRHLAAQCPDSLAPAAAVRPVVLDEGLIDLESLRQAQAVGYNGIAFKACKGQSPTLLLAAAAQKAGLFLCVQDLTCPGASLIHSAGLAAHIPGVAAIESNARQYMPAANRPWEERFPGIFRVTDGMLATGELTGLGLGAVAD
jgi:L-alanine-DL-glutamate epimerase-like enolase superfamily enzyme